MAKQIKIILWVVVLLGFMTQRTNAQEIASLPLTIQPGDSWAALALRFQVDELAVRQLNPHLNSHRQPAVGSLITLPETAVAQDGHMLRPFGSILRAAAGDQSSPWLMAIRNNLSSPAHPALYRAIFVPETGAEPRELPAGFTSLAFSHAVGVPGQAVAFRAEVAPDLSVTAVLGGIDVAMFKNGRFLVGLTGTGAFFGTQQPTLMIQVDGEPIWEQPWQFRDPATWTFQQITLTGTAAQIDQQSIADERARLFAIWEQNSGPPLWNAPFQLPIDSFLEISSPYGARRSYNGGPYRTYHEGVDFSAYGGTPVLAPAAGTVVVAEFLYVRGGAVIIDHGLGVYSGYYHLSSLAVGPNEQVLAGQKVGEVGTTGLSTGNHLHWDLLVNGIWVDAQAWLALSMDCWILAGLDFSCG